MHVVRRRDGAALLANVSAQHPGGPPVLTIGGEVFGPTELDGYILADASLAERMELIRGGYKLTAVSSS
jgi:hypothetical protein